MADDLKKLIAASREFFWLRRCFWASLLLGFLAFGCFAVPVMVAGDRLSESARNGLGVATVISGVITWGGGLVTWLCLLNFRCPRCGKHFILGRGSTLPTSTCKHCHLNLSRGRRL